MRLVARWVALFVALWFVAGASVEAQQNVPRRLTLREAIALALK